MRMDSTLDVTPEGSLSEIPAAVGGVEEPGRELRTHQNSEEKLQEVNPSTNVITSAEETPNTLVKMIPGRNVSEQGLSQVESQGEFKGPERQVERMQ